MKSDLLGSGVGSLLPFSLPIPLLLLAPVTAGAGGPDIHVGSPGVTRAPPHTHTRTLLPVYIPDPSTSAQGFSFVAGIRISPMEGLLIHCTPLALR